MQPTVALVHTTEALPRAQFDSNSPPDLHGQGTVQSKRNQSKSTVKQVEEIYLPTSKIKPVQANSPIFLATRREIAQKLAFPKKY